MASTASCEGILAFTCLRGIKEVLFPCPWRGPCCLHGSTWTYARDNAGTRPVRSVKVDWTSWKQSHDCSSTCSFGVIGERDRAILSVVSQLWLILINNFFKITFFRLKTWKMQIETGSSLAQIFLDFIKHLYFSRKMKKVISFENRNGRAWQFSLHIFSLVFKLSICFPGRFVQLASQTLWTEADEIPVQYGPGPLWIPL